MNLPLRFFHRTIRLRVRILLLVLLSVAGATQAQTIRYVKSTASGNGSGSSWANASNNLQAMIDASDSGQQVWVAGGTYRPAAISSFSMKDGVAIYGGFAGNESRLADRPAINPVAGRPSSSTLGGNGRSVISNPPGLTNAARLDGFVIAGGNATYGGGMYNVGGSSPDIANCSFQNNTGSNGLGGGMYNRGSSNPVLTNCLFQGNTAPEGGGMCNAGSSPTLTNCSFQSNTGSTIFSYGAGMYNLDSSSPTLTNCSFLTNTISDGNGGGMYNENSSNPNLANCLFQGNSAPHGGGMYNERNSRPALVNCSFLNNSASYGAGMDNSTSSPRLTNCSFQNNTASTGGAMDSFYGSSPILTNCVVWGNGGANTFSGDKLTASYSLFEESATNYTDGGHNLAPPRTPFLTTTSTQLNGCAPAIDTGSNEAYTTAGGPATDLGGHPRLFSGAAATIDRGAYEYQANPTTFSLNNPAVNMATVGQAFSQAFTSGGGSSPYSYSVASGNLPTGLSLSTAGVLSGTPTQSGSFSLTVRAQDANGCAGVGSPYALVVNTLIRYVKPTASGNGSGSNWANASGNLQAMIDASGSGQQVWVQDGTYQPAVNTSFAMKDGVGLYGGFAGNESRVDDRPAVNPLSGQPARSTLKGNGNSVIYNPKGLSRTALLDGFIITGGSVGLNISVITGGGGMYNENSSPSLTNCSFQSNSAYYGGGMLNINSSPMLTNCSFQNNTATIYGGGMFNQGSNNPVLTNCSFQNNSAGNYGGGMLNSDSNPTMVNCSFQGNRGESGGVMYNRVGSNPVLTNGVVFGNGGANTFINVNGSSVSASYSLFEASVTDYTDGGNNFTTTRSPFVNTTSTKLNNCAPAINTGSNAAYARAGGPVIDLAVQPRTFPANGQIDRGAYEYQAGPGSLVSVSNPSVGTATAGAPFSQAFTASGGASAYSFSVVSSNLPASLSLSTAGLLSGTPTQPGGYSLTVQATDGADGCAGTVSAVYTLTVSPASPIRYVKQRSSGTGSGSSWADASGDLQSQIDLAGAQQVWVATGTYQPAANSSFALKNGVVLYGGFVGTESNLGQRPTVNPLTARPSGSELKANGDRIINNPSGLNNTARLDGFVIAGGDAPTGGGMYNEDSSPGIANCVFQNNKATPNGNGGGMYNLNSSPALTNCLFLSNSAFNGGGIYNSGSNPTLINCSFQGNSAIGYGYGGGMYTTGSTTMRLTNCSFQNNTAHIGGGMFTNNSSSLRLTDCDFQENSASQGGGMYNSGSNPVLASCSFQGNSAHHTIYSSANYGGGIYNDGSSPALTNCNFQGNSADVWGGGVYNEGSSPVLTNCSFQGNMAAQGRGLYNSSRSSASLTNGVLFGNGAANTFYNENGSSVSASYSLFDASVTGYTDGGHNLTTTVSPFVSTTSTQLTGCAPAINTGNNAAYASAGGYKTDLAGQPRLFPVNGPGTPDRIDMGAYEYQANPTVITVSNPATTTATAGVAFSQPFTASGGSSPYSYSVVSSSLPASLSLSASGLLSGTPTSSGSYSVLVQASDGNNCVGISGLYSLTVSPAAPLVPILTGFTASPNAVCAGSPLTFTATVGNVTGSYAYTLTNGLGTPTANALTGTGSTSAFSQLLTATGAGSQNFTLTVSSNGQSATATTSVLVNALPVAGLVSSGPLTCAQTSVTLTASGAADDPGSSYTFSSADGSVLAGADNSRVVNTPGSYLVTVANASGCVSTTSTSVISNTATVTVSNPATGVALINVPFSQPFTASGGAGSYSYSVVSSNLPASLSLSGAGVLSGTPTQSGSYSVLVQATDANGCAGVSEVYTLVVSDATPTLTGFVADTNPVCAGSLLTFTATVGNVTGSYTYTLTNGMGTPTGSTTKGSAIGSIFSQTLTASAPGSQRFTLTVTSKGQTATTTTPLTVNALPTLTLSAAPSATLTCAQTSLVLTAGGGDTYTFGGPATGVPKGNILIADAAGIYSVTATTNGGCSSTAMIGVTSATAVVSVTNPAQTMTTLGTPFSQTFTATSGVSGSSAGYSFALASGVLPTGLVLSTAGVLSGAATRQGSFPIAVSATDANGCTGMGPVYTLSIPTTQFTVLSRDPENGNLNTNTLKPYLLLQNDGGSLIPYGELTVRYWLTLENPVPLRFDINYAQMGNDRVHLNYVPVSPARQGASGYIEFSFDASAGSLAGGSSAVIQDLINKQDYSMFFQGDDYSYVNNLNFAPNPRITAYRNGVLVYGQEPGQVTVDNTPLTLTASASPTTILTTGSTTLQAIASGGTSPFSYAFTGPGTISPSGNTATVSGLPAGVQTFIVTVTDATAPTNQTSTATVSVTVTAPPANQPPVASPNTNQTATVGVNFTYTANAFSDETPGSLIYTASVNPPNNLMFNPATRMIQGTPQTTGITSVTITATDAGGLSASTVFTITVNPKPVVTPLTLTLSASPTTILTTGSSTLSAQAAGGTPGAPDRGYSYSFQGPGSIQTSGSTATVSNLPAGVQTFTVTVSDATTPVNQTIATTISVTVSTPVASTTQLTVLSRDPENGNLTTNTLKPYLLLKNDGGSPIPYGELTVRYWLTVENPVPLRFDINYAQMGNDKVHLSYVPVSPARQGAGGYIEFSFDAAAGSLGAGSNAVIQDLINKQDYSMFFQGDDYSYVNNPNFAPNPHTTAYRNGVLIYGVEPPAGARMGVENADEVLQVRVLGNPVSGSELAVEVRGAGGQPLRLRVTDLTGHLVGEKALERAGSVEQQRLPVGDASAGLLFLQVSTPAQTQTVKVMRLP